MTPNFFPFKPSLNPNPTRGGAYFPHKFSNAYSSGTDSWIDLKSGCNFVRCLEV